MNQKFSNSFVPYIPKEQFDDVASDFLNKYCPEALKTPMAIPIWDIAKNRIQLEIYDTELLSDKNTILGAITLCDGIIDVFDPEINAYKGIEVQKGMVFIDSGMLNDGRRNNTLAHECVHWFKHRPYFIRNRQGVGMQAIAFRCPVEETNKTMDEEWADAEIMEWQARNIAPRILMPKNTTLVKVKEFLAKHNYSNDKYAAVKETIEELSEFFEVSKQSAVIRMVDFGYEVAREFYNYNNEIDFSPYKQRNFKINQRGLSKKTVQKISSKEAYEEYRRNKVFREIIHSGAFKYINGFFVINDKKYIASDEEGKQILTEYAETHMSECVLSFSFKLDGYVPQDSGNSTDMFYMYKAESYSSRKTYSTNTQNSDVFDRWYSGEEMRRQLEERRNLPRSFNEMFKYLFDNRKWTTQKFKDMTLLSDNELSRIRKNPPQTSKRTMVAVCIGMKLPLDTSLEFMRAAGIVLVDTNDEDAIYKYILSCNFGDIDSANDFLIANDFKPLGQQEKVSA